MAGSSLKRTDKKFAIVLAAVFSVLAAIIASHHEMWRDEIEAWLISRDSSSIASLFKNLEYQGHPGLWHICLYLLKFITRSPAIMQVFHLVIAGTTVYFFANFSPFGRLQKILFAFGYFPFYEYSVICRNYALAVLFLFLACVLYEKRYERFLLISVVLFLLSHTSVHGEICAISILVALLLDYHIKRLRGRLPLRRIPILCGFLLIVTGLVTSTIQVKPPHDSWFLFSLPGTFDSSHLADVFGTVGKAFFPVSQVTFHFWDSNLLDRLHSAERIRLLLAGLIVLFSTIVLFRKPVALLIYTLGTIGMLVFFYCIYLGYMRHFGFLFMIFLSALWISRSEGTKPSCSPGAKRSLPGSVFTDSRCRIFENIILTLILSIHLFGGILAAGMDYRYTFSQAKSAATYIRGKSLDNMLMVGDHDYAVSAISGYLDKKFYYPRGDRFGSFVIWDRKRMRMSVPHLLQRVDELSTKTGQDILVILNYPLGKGFIARHSLIEEKRFEEAVVGSETYYLYIRKAG